MEYNFLPFVINFWPFYAYESLRHEEKRNHEMGGYFYPLPPATPYCLFLITAFCFALNNNKIKNENKWERKTNDVILMFGQQCKQN
jgi:hypothetical protein